MNERADRGDEATRLLLTLFTMCGQGGDEATRAAAVAMKAKQEEIAVTDIPYILVAVAL